MYNKAFLLMILAVLLSASGCSCSSTPETMTKTAVAAGELSADTNDFEAVTAELPESVDKMFSDRDLDCTYVEAQSYRISLTGDSAYSDCDKVQISGSAVTIPDEGTYILSGTLDNGSVIVNAKDTNKVRLVLDGVHITSSDSAAIYIAQADKAFITTAPGSENTLTNGGEYAAVDESNIDAVIFSKADLTLNGTGTLSILAKAGHGIVSKDDLVLTGGAYSITAAAHGLCGKDSVRIAAGTYAIEAGKDAIHAENADDEGLGFLYVAGGSFNINSGDDAVHSDSAVLIQDGVFEISCCNEGLEGLSLTIDGGNFDIASADDGLNAADPNGSSGFGGRQFGSDPFAAQSSSFITINGGYFKIVSDGDCIDSNGALTINGGMLELTCNGNGNTALDCDGLYTHNGGDVATNDGSESAPGQFGGMMQNRSGMEQGGGMRGPGRMGQGAIGQ